MKLLLTQLHIQFNIKKHTYIKKSKSSHQTMMRMNRTYEDDPNSVKKYFQTLEDERSTFRYNS